MAPGFLTSLAKTNCFSLSTNPSLLLPSFFLPSFISMSIPNLHPPSQFSVPFPIFTSFIFFPPIKTPTRSTTTTTATTTCAKTLSAKKQKKCKTLYLPHSYYWYFTLLIIIYLYPSSPVSSVFVFWGPFDFAFWSVNLDTPFAEFEFLGLQFSVGGAKSRSFSFYEWGLRGPWLIEKVEETFVNCQEKPLPAATQGGTGGVRRRCRRFRSYSTLARMSLPLVGPGLSLPLKTLTPWSLF